MLERTNIRKEADAIRADYPGLSSATHAHGRALFLLQSLGRACGMTAEAADAADAATLIGVYRSALKGDAHGQTVATRAQARHDLKHGRAPVTPQAPQPSGLFDTAGLDALNARLGTLEQVHGLDVKRLERDTADAVKRLATEGADALKGEVSALIASAVADALKAQQPTRLEIVRADAPEPVGLGIVHKDMPTLLRMLKRAHVYIYGPAGTGKTTTAEQCATALGLKFYCSAKLEDAYGLLGFRQIGTEQHPEGLVVRTPFRDAYEYGGLFLFDEYDGSNEQATVALNMAMANKKCPFPDGLVNMHPDFKCIAAGNTALKGADHQYTGRNKLDASSVDRFAFLQFGIDEHLERAIAPNAAWCEYVQGVRARVADRGIDCLVTPRATIMGADLLEEGFDWHFVAESVIFKGLEPSVVAQVKGSFTDA